MVNPFCLSSDTYVTHYGVDLREESKEKPLPGKGNGCDLFCLSPG